MVDRTTPHIKQHYQNDEVLFVNLKQLLQSLLSIRTYPAILPWISSIMFPVFAFGQSDLLYSEFSPFATSVSFLLKATDEQLIEAANSLPEYTYQTQEHTITYDLTLDNEHRVTGEVRFTDTVRFTSATWYFFSNVYVEGQFSGNRPIDKWTVYDMQGAISKVVYFVEDQVSPFTIDHYQVEWYIDEGDTLVDQGTGTYITYWPQGSIHSIGTVLEGVKHHCWAGFAPDGSLLYEESYQQGELLHGTSFTEDGATYSYDSLHTSLYPIGGWQAYYQGIEERLHYPEKARRAGVEGVVYLRTIVERDGSLNEIEVVQGIGMGCDQEAVKAVRQGPHWHPTTIRGQPVRLRSVLPITFNLYPKLKSLPPPRKKPSSSP